VSVLSKIFSPALVCFVIPAIFTYLKIYLSRMNSNRHSIIILAEITRIAVLSSMVIPVLAVQSTPIIQQKNNMSDAASAIVAEIKRTCQIMVSENRELSQIVPLFGTPAKEPTNQYDLDPFSPYLNVVSLNTNNAEPSLVHTIDLIPKPQGSISIGELKEVFGEYYHLLSYNLNLKWYRTVFEYKPSEAKYTCDIMAEHLPGSEGMERSIAQSISIHRKI
jgi:hypothetical protein